MPGLLQTEAYARALLRAGLPEASDDAIEELVAARLERQERLKENPPPRLWVILDEAVIRRPVGGSEAMREQLGALLPLVDTAYTTIQILPFRHGEHPLQGGSLELLTLQDGSVVAYSEGSDTGALLEESTVVEERRRAYDLLRAYALTPRETAAMIMAAMEELSHA